jgi:hypothetical protein
VAQSESLPEPARPEALPLLEPVAEGTRVQGEALGCEVRQLLQERALAAAWKGGLDCIEIEKIGKLHGLDSSPAAAITLPRA